MKKEDVERLSLSGAMAACEELGLPTSFNKAEMVAALKASPVSKVELPEDLFLVD